MWGSAESLREIKALVNLIEQSQQQLPAMEQQQAEGTQAVGNKQQSSPFAK